MTIKSTKTLDKPRIWETVWNVALSGQKKPTTLYVFRTLMELSMSQPFMLKKMYQQLQIKGHLLSESHLFKAFAKHLRLTIHTLN